MTGVNVVGGLILVLYYILIIYLIMEEPNAIGTKRKFWLFVLIPCSFWVWNFVMNYRKLT